MQQRKLLWDVIIVVTEAVLGIALALVQDVVVFVKEDVKVRAKEVVIGFVWAPAPVHVMEVVLVEVSINL